MFRLSGGEMIKPIRKSYVRRDNGNYGYPFPKEFRDCEDCTKCIKFNCRHNHVKDKEVYLK
jgi:hypothetical protein